MNLVGLYTLFAKEVWRFFKVVVQTVLTPAITSLLFLVVFGQALRGHVEVFPGVDYITFLVPGLIMMTVIQNAFANSSSSLIQAKMNGSVLFMQVAPLSPLEILLAYTGAAVVRGALCGAVVWLAALPFVDLPLQSLGWVLLFGILASAVLGMLGLIAGIWASKFDQMAAFQNFIIVPLSFLSGVFYSVATLPSPWQELSRMNPFFYMIDGFRYGFFGISDVSPWLSLSVVAGALLLCALLTGWMLRSGYRMRE